MLKIEGTDIGIGIAINLQRTRLRSSLFMSDEQNWQPHRWENTYIEDCFATRTSPLQDVVGGFSLGSRSEKDALGSGSEKVVPENERDGRKRLIAVSPSQGAIKGQKLVQGRQSLMAAPSPKVALFYG